MVGKILRKSPLTVMDGGFASFSNVELSGGKTKASEEYDWGEPVGREIW